MRLLDRSVRVWLDEARSSKGYARARAWANALAAARRAPGWRVVYTGAVVEHQARLVEVTRGRRGRAHYLNGRVGVERSW